MKEGSTQGCTNQVKCFCCKGGAFVSDIRKVAFVSFTIKKKKKKKNLKEE